MDAEGNYCGKTAGYEDYPMLWWQNIDNESYLPFGVCVQQCPSPT